LMGQIALDDRASPGDIENGLLSLENDTIRGSFLVTFGIFVHRPDSIYEDTPAERYHFPSQYLGRMAACVGDWIIYYEPRKVAETRGYFAVAKVQQIVPDPTASGMHFALIEPGSYLDFANPVPFSGPDGVIERGVLNEAGRISGRAQSAVRPISAADFHRILEIGLAEDAALLPRVDDPVRDAGLQEVQTPFLLEQNRDRTTSLTSRLIRDRVFRRIVLRAYDARCAITGSTAAAEPKWKRHTSGRWRQKAPISSVMDLPYPEQRIGCSIAA